MVQPMRSWITFLVPLLFLKLGWEKVWEQKRFYLSLLLIKTLLAIKKIIYFEYENLILNL